MIDYFICQNCKRRSERLQRFRFYCSHECRDIAIELRNMRRRENLLFAEKELLIKENK